MKENLEDLFKLDRQLLGSGYDSALDYIGHLVQLEKISILSGTRLGTWEVPEEWILKDGWVKFKGKKIIDLKNDPMTVMTYSVPVHKTMTLDELRPHLNYLDDSNAVPFTFSFYDKKWGFNVPKSLVRQPNIEGVTGGVVEMDGKSYVMKTRDNLEEGGYEVFIDSEFKKGVMNIGVHTKKGKSEREILLFAHLDHAYMANDNLSGVVCLLNLLKDLDCEHTIKLVFCPETIGSIAYSLTQDLSKIDFVIAVDICGNDNSLLLQKTWDVEHRLNRVSHCAIQGMGDTYRKGMFRNTIGSDEYAFNDPLIGVPGIMLSRWPYKEYHTNEDTPEKIDYSMIARTGAVIKNIIEIWEKDYIPKRNFKGPLMRSLYGIQTNNQQVNLGWDYFIYSMDGKRSLAELCCEFGLNFDYTYDLMERMINDKTITRTTIGQRKVRKARGKKQERLPWQPDVSSPNSEVPQPI